MPDERAETEGQATPEEQAMQDLLTRDVSADDGLEAADTTTDIAWFERMRHEAEADQRAGLRTWLMVLASGALLVELVALVCVVFFQGFRAWGFSLDVPTLNIFATTLVIQTFLIIRIIATNLFPQDGSFFSQSQKRK